MAKKTEKRRVFHGWYSEQHAKYAAGYSEWAGPQGSKRVTFVTLQQTPGDKEYDYSDRVYVGPVYTFERRVITGPITPEPTA